MAWNLIDALSPAGGPRRFSAPLAAALPGGAAPVVDRALLDINPDSPDHLEAYAVAANGNTSDILLTVRINAPVGGFANVGALPDPMIRLHAMDVAMVTFRPGTAGGPGDSLALAMPTFALPLDTTAAGGVRWWRRWLDAKHVPEVAVYENVDRAELTTLLNAVAAPPTDLVRDRVAATNGLSFPAGVTQANKNQFITDFLAGAPNHFMVAEVGALVGTAGRAVAADASPRLVRFHVQYSGHAVASPRPMNPREFLHLLFGNDSVEALNHALLLRIGEVALTQNNVHPESKRMLLRPPLRTWKRVMWEGDQEINNHAANWAPAGSLGPRRLFNSHQRGARAYNRWTYATFNKCNLFASDIPLRAGFRICVHPPSATTFHYLDANSYTNAAHRQLITSERTPLTGVNADANVTWGTKIERWVTNQPAGDQQRLLNEAMTEEGRCFILAGARARIFKPVTVGGQQRISNCVTQLRPTGIGHIVIVREVRAQPVAHGTPGSGLQALSLLTQEARENGAANGAREGNNRMERGGQAGAAAAANGYIRLHLIELHPGGDPDTTQGLRDLNVLNVNRNLLGLADEAAPNAAITHDAAGNPVPPGSFCHDNYLPQAGPPTVVP